MAAVVRGGTKSGLLGGVVSTHSLRTGGDPSTRGVAVCAWSPCQYGIAITHTEEARPRVRGTPFRPAPVACWERVFVGLEIACKICINSDSAMNFVLLLLASAAAARDLPVKTLAPPADVVLQENATIGCDSWKSCATCEFTSIKPGVYLKLCDHRCWWVRRVYMVQKRCWIMHDHCNN
jgi:hypothetical protein